MEKIILFFKNLLSISYSESRAFSRLLLVCILALLVIFLTTKFYNPGPIIKQSDIAKLDSLVQLLDPQNAEPVYFSFNPNSISADSLILLGIPQKIAERLINYRAKGGSFKAKNDITKIYGFTNEMYERVYPYIILPDKIPENTNEMTFADINEIGVEWLKDQPGISPLLAGRIVRYRDNLGGFVKTDQLDEVYELEGFSLENLKKNIYIRKGYQPEKLKINHVSKDQLKNHPYISWQLAEDIVRFRELNGSIKSEKLLVGFKSLDKANFENLILYLDFQ